MFLDVLSVSSLFRKNEKTSRFHDWKDIIPGQEKLSDIRMLGFTVKSRLPAAESGLDLLVIPGFIAAGSSEAAISGIAVGRNRRSRYDLPWPRITAEPPTDFSNLSLCVDRCVRDRLM